MNFLKPAIILLCIPKLLYSQKDYIVKGYIAKEGHPNEIYNKRYSNNKLVYVREPITLLSSIGNNPNDYRTSKYKYLNDKLINIYSVEETVNSFTTFIYNVMGNKQEEYTNYINKFKENNDDIIAKRILYTHNNNILSNTHEWYIYGNGDTSLSKIEHFLYDSINRCKNVITLRFHNISEQIKHKYYEEEDLESFKRVDTLIKLSTYFSGGYKTLVYQKNSTITDFGLIEDGLKIVGENYINLDSFKSFNSNQYLLIHKEHKLIYSNYIEKYNYDELNRIKTINYIYKDVEDTIKGEVTFKYFTNRKKSKKNNTHK